MAKKISSELEGKICELYDNGNGTNEISKSLEIHRATVQRTLIRRGVELRKTSPYKKKYNVKFFDTYTPESCYWAGFILADGTIRTDRDRDRDGVEIHLQEGDEIHLRKFAKAIGFTGKLAYDKSSNAYSISVAGKWFPNALKNNFSIEGRKSLKSIFPIQVPKQYWVDLIRGIFDGDGCITYTTCPTINFIGTNVLLSFLRSYFYDLGVRLKSKNKFTPLIPTTNGAISHIHYSGRNACKILRKLYDSSNRETRLDRKYQRFMEYFTTNVG